MFIYLPKVTFMFFCRCRTLGTALHQRSVVTWFPREAKLSAMVVSVCPALPRERRSFQREESRNSAKDTQLDVKKPPQP